MGCAVSPQAKLRKHLAATSREKRRPANGLIPVDFRFVEQLNFDDPYDKDHKKDATRNVASFPQARRQALHLSHALLEASRWRSECGEPRHDSPLLCSHRFTRFSPNM